MSSSRKRKTRRSSAVDRTASVRRRAGGRRNRRLRNVPTFSSDRASVTP